VAIFFLYDTKTYVKIHFYKNDKERSEESEEVKVK